MTTKVKEIMELVHVIVDRMSLKETIVFAACMWADIFMLYCPKILSILALINGVLNVDIRFIIVGVCGFIGSDVIEYWIGAQSPMTYAFLRDFAKKHGTKEEESKES